MTINLYVFNLFMVLFALRPYREFCLFRISFLEQDIMMPTFGGAVFEVVAVGFEFCICARVLADIERGGE